MTNDVFGVSAPAPRITTAAVFIIAAVLSVPVAVLLHALTLLF